MLYVYDRLFHTRGRAAAKLSSPLLLCCFVLNVYPNSCCIIIHYIRMKIRDLELTFF